VASGICWLVSPLSVNAAAGNPRLEFRTCDIQSVGVDTTHGNTEQIAFSGRALAQVFLAQDTLISAITVWRPASEQGFIAGMHLYLCGVDSLLKPLPATTVLLDGPTISLLVAGPTPAPIRYSFDPPFALPKPGHYTLAVKEEDPNCDNLIPLLADSTESYPEGHAWVIHPFVDCHGLGSNAIGIQCDLTFQIDFCQMADAVVPGTWGQLKARYH
jgi:hypothetical protein